MGSRSRSVSILAGIFVLATAVPPAAARDVGTTTAEIDFGRCREVVTTKAVRSEAVAPYLPAELGDLPPGEVDLVIRATKCRWLTAGYGDHGGRTKQPIIIHVGIAPAQAPVPLAVDPAVIDDHYSLFTVTTSRALARAARAAGHARVYVTENVRFRLAQADSCGDPVRTLISVRDDRAPSFVVRGTVPAPGPRCEPEHVGPTVWWTVRNGVASAFMYLERVQTVAAADTGLEVWAARNTRLHRIVGSAHFMSDSSRTGIIRAADRSPDAVVVPHLLAV